MSFDAADTGEWPAANLLYLFGGDVLPHPHFNLSHLWTTEHAVHLPCHGGSVTLGPLESHLFAWAFWQLHRSAVVDLRLVSRPDRKRQDDWLGLDIEVRRTSDINGTQGVLAEELHARCTDEASLLSSVIVAWGAAKGVKPKTIDFLPLEAIVALIQLDVCVFLGVEPTTDAASIECERVALLRPQFDRWRDAWGTFADHDTELATALVRCCDAGLSRLRPPKTAAFVS